MGLGIIDNKSDEGNNNNNNNNKKIIYRLSPSKFPRRNEVSDTFFDVLSSIVTGIGFVYGGI